MDCILETENDKYQLTTMLYRELDTERDQQVMDVG